MKKKILSLLLVCTMAASMAACGGNDNGGKVDPEVKKAAADFENGKFKETKVMTAVPILRTTCIPTTSRRACLRITT